MPQADRQGTPSGVPEGDALRGLQAAGGAPLADGEPTSGTEAVSSPPSADGSASPGTDGSAGAETVTDGSTPGKGNRRKLVLLLGALALLVYLADLISKTVVLRTLEGEPPYVMIPGVLQFRVIFNSGAAFSIGTGMTFVFTLIAAGVVVAIIRTARRLRSLPWAICLGLLLGGALGNLTDRLFRYPGGFQGHVVDFIEVLPDNFPFIGNFPIWNVADAAIVCGGVLAVILAWRGYQLDGTRELGKEVTA